MKNLVEITEKEMGEFRKEVEQILDLQKALFETISMGLAEIKTNLDQATELMEERIKSITGYYEEED